MIQVNSIYFPRDQKCNQIKERRSMKMMMMMIICVILEYSINIIIVNLNEEAKALEKILPFGIINPYGKPK